MDRETLGACNTYQFTVLDCPLDRQVAVRTALENRVEYATELPVQSDELLSKTMRGVISFSWYLHQQKGMLIQSISIPFCFC